MNLNNRKSGRDAPGGSSPGVRDDGEFSPYIRSAGNSRQCSRIDNDRSSQVSSSSGNHHPFEVNCEVSPPKRGSQATRSLGPGHHRRRAEHLDRNRSHSQEELGSLVDVESKYLSPRVRGKDSVRSRKKSIEDFLPSRVAACDGMRTIAFRRSRRSRRRSSGRLRRGDDVEMVALDARVEDVVDSPANIEVELSEEMTIGELKSCATTMEKKKRKREQLLLDQARTEQIGYRKWLPSTNKALWRRWGQNVASLSQHLELWTSSFKEIEGKFGASVYSYFIFVRLLFFMNLFMTLIIIAAIIAPQLSIHSFRTNCIGVNSSDSVLWKSCNFSYWYQKHMEEVRGNSNNGDLVVDFFKGTGWMENSSLFFGFYWNEGHSSTRYNMALAYLLTTAVYLAAIFVFMVIYTGKGLKEQMLLRTEQPSNTFERVFCGWDYSLCQPTSAREKHKSIYRELDKIYTAWKNRQNKVTLSLCDKFRLYCTRVFVHILVIIQLIGAGAAIAFTITIATPKLQEMKFVKDQNFLDLTVSYLPSFVLIMLNLTLPMIFRNIVLWEKYSEENQLRISLVRTVFLRLASIAALVITVVVQIHRCDGEPCRISDSKVVVHCWETYLGQALYRLVLLDFAVVVITILLYDFPQNYLFKRFPENCLLKLFGKQEFDVPQNVIDITYAQALCWIGAFFSPLIPAMTALKLLIFFFAKKASLMRNYNPKPSRASGTTYFFMIILMITFILCAAAISYAVGRLLPSKSCGPFRFYADENFLMFNALTIAIESLQPSAHAFFAFIGSWVFYMILVILLSFLIIWYQMRSSAHQEMVEFLKERLKIENQDKKFLLDRWKALHAPRQSTGATR